MKAKKHLLVASQNGFQDNRFTTAISFPAFWFCSLEVYPRPQHASVNIEYSPGCYSIDRLSLGEYLLSFRDELLTLEDATNTILNDLVQVIRPVWMRVACDQVNEIGMTAQIVAEYVSKEEKLKEMSNG